MDLSYIPIKQKMRIILPKMSRIISEEVSRLLDAIYIIEVLYPSWIANTVVPKKGGKLRVCIDYTYLNKA